jgi:hypothetical protein
MKYFSLKHTGFALLGGLSLSSVSVQADTTDIYRQSLVAGRSLTVLALDSNVEGSRTVCSNPFDAAALTATNPETAACQEIRQTLTVQDYLNAQSERLQGAAAGSVAACRAALPIVAMSSAEAVLATRIGDLSPLASTALATCLGGIGPGALALDNAGVVAAAVGSLVTTLGNVSVMQGGNPLNNSLVNTINSVTSGGGINLLNGLLDSRLAMMVSHANRGPRSTTPLVMPPATSPAVPSPATTPDPQAALLPCAFADQRSIPGERFETTQCSNGTYFLLGFKNLLNPTELTSSLLKINYFIQGFPPIPLPGVPQIPTSTSGVIASALQLVPMATTPAVPSPTTPTVPTTPGVPTAPAAPSPSVNVQVPIPGVGHPYQAKEFYNELVRYLRGDRIYNAHQGTFDYGDNNPNDNLNTSGVAVNTRAWDTSIENGNNYQSGLITNQGCDTNLVHLQFSEATGDGDSDADLLNIYPSADRNKDGFLSLAEVVNAASSGFNFSGISRKIRSTFIVRDTLAVAGALDQTSATVFKYSSMVGLFGLSTEVAQLLNPTLITDASFGIFSLAPGNTLGENGVAAYASLFRPVENQKPNWTGNLKRLNYQFSTSSQSFVFKDAQGDNAIADDGRIKTTASTFWGGNDDGRTVMKGGAGERIPGFRSGGGGNPGRGNSQGQRQIFYDLPLTPSGFGWAAMDADDTNTQNVLIAPMGATATPAVPGICTPLVSVCPTIAGRSAAQVTHELILHARGFDVGTTSSPKGTGGNSFGVTGRPWLMGALLRSEPVAINYGKTGARTTNDVRVVFGAADGLMRMIRDDDGREMWGFMPRAVMNQVKTLRDESSGALPQGVDGSPTVLFIDRNPANTGKDGKIEASNPNDFVGLYFGLRSSGRNYYGLNITNPDQPSILWNIQGGGAASNPFQKLALTYARPTLGRLRVGSNTVPVLFLSGGYNGTPFNGTATGKDIGNGTTVGSNDSIGNALYIVNARTGALIWKAEEGSFNPALPFNPGTQTFSHPMLTDSIPAEVTAIDNTGDGITDRLYVPDTGGRVWRVDLQGNDVSKWTLAPIASIGRHNSYPTPAVGAPVNQQDRRFFEAVDFVPVVKRAVAYDAVIVTSGNGDHPLSTGTQNFLYVLYDPDTSNGKVATDTNSDNGIITSENDPRLRRHADTGSSADFTDLSNCTSDACVDTVAQERGWRILLPETGEKGISAPVTTGGLITFTSYVPTAGPSSCIPSEGKSKIYAVRLDNGRADPRILFFNNQRAVDASARGIAGRPLAASGRGNLMVGSNNIELPVRPVWRTGWKERRGDDEKPVTQ